MELLKQIKTVIIICPLEDDNKFISSDPEHRTVIEQPADDIAAGLDESISGTVTLLVINLLQTVDIADNDCKLRFFFSFKLNIKLHLVVYICMLVLYAGKSVPVRHIYGRHYRRFVLDLLLPCLVDILYSYDYMILLPVGVHDYERHILRLAVYLKSVVEG